MTRQRREYIPGLSVMEVYDSTKRTVLGKVLISISRLAVVWHVLPSLRLGFVDDLLAVHGQVN